MKKFYFSLIAILAIICLEIIKYFVNFIAFYSLFAIQIALIILIIVLLCLKIKFKKFLAISLSLILVSIISPITIALCKTVTLPNTFDYVVHAGGGIDNKAYLNSQEGFEKFANSDFNYIEIDFLYTKDKKIVASHLYEHLESYNFNNRPTYEEFKNTLLDSSYHGITFDWLIERLLYYPNIKIIFDTKEKDTIALLKDMVLISQEKNFDIFSRFIIQVYSYENYNMIKNDKVLAFEHFWYTNYKSLYSYKEIDKYFGDKEDVETIVLHTDDWWVMYQTNYKFNKNIAVHTVHSINTVNFLASKGVNFIYIDEML